MATVEAAARARVDLPPARLFIGGEWVEAESGRTFPTENPATEEVLCEVASAGRADVDRAVGAARSALLGDTGD
jgi:phenylacetaldehyde dehydrogenase